MKQNDNAAEQILILIIILVLLWIWASCRTVDIRSHPNSTKYEIIRQYEDSILYYVDNYNKCSDSARKYSDNWCDVKFFSDSARYHIEHAKYYADRYKYLIDNDFIH